MAALRKQDQEALIEAIIDEVAEAVCVVGTPDEARRKVARYAGVTTMPRFMSVGPRAKGICPREPRSHRGDVYRLLAASPSRERDRQIMTSNTTIKRAYADTKYGQVHYRHTGSGDPLVLMHWCPGNGRQYQNTLAQFAERGYAAFAPDLAGYGDSDKPDRQWSIEDFAVNLGEFLDFLNLDSVFLVGGHTSAAISTEFAVKNPRRVRRLLLDGSPAWDAKRRAEMTGTYVPPLKLTPEGDHMMWAWKRSYRRPEMPLERVFAACVDLLKAGFTYHTGYEAVFAYDMEVRLPEIRVPTLALTSEEDPLFEEHKKVTRLVPGVKEHSFKGRGPLGEPDRASEFVEVVDAFMRSSA